MSAFLYGAHVRANGVRLHYLRYGGTGTAVVLVPGITSPAITWGFVAERFARNFDVYVLDVRGRGLSSAVDGLDYRSDALAKDIAEFVVALGLGDHVAIGHSMGARIVARAVSRHAMRPQRVVLVDPPMSGPGRRPYPSPLAWYVDSLRASVAGTDADAMRAYLPTWTDEELRLRAEWLLTCNEGAVVRAYRDFHEDDFCADLPALSMPVRLIAAGKGGVVSTEDEIELRRLVPTVEMVRVAGAGHMIPWDDADGFYAAFGNFLGRPL
jgi:N-formylmaleamate deformylase